MNTRPNTPVQAPAKKKSLWAYFNQYLPGATAKVVFILIVIGAISMLFRWLKTHV